MPPEAGEDRITCMEPLTTGHSYSFTELSAETVNEVLSLISGRTAVVSQDSMRSLRDALAGKIGAESVPIEDFRDGVFDSVVAAGCVLPSGASAVCTVSPGMKSAEFYLPSLRAGCGRIITAGGEDAPHDGICLLSDDDSRMIRFSSDGFKNSRGHIAVIGGSDKYTGAPRLAARAAFFSGAGLVTIITDSERIRDENPAVMIAPYGCDLSRFDALAMGPGWGEGSAAEFDRAASSGKNIVIDADALTLVPGHSFSHRAVLTPHIGEYRRLMSAMDIPCGLESAASLAAALRELALRTESVVVLKSSVLWITDGGNIFIYDGSNPSLGVAGSGDVLCGIIASLMGAGESPERAAIDGVILHQRAGRKAHEKYGFYSAEELILEVGRAR